MSLSKFFFDTPLYSQIEVNDGYEDTFNKIIEYQNKEEFEGYNPWRKLESTFVVITDLVPSGKGSSDFYTKGGYGTVKIKCKRTDDIFWFFILWDPTTKALVKIGQYPTVADFHLSELNQYTKVIPNEKLKEFSRAIGLAANGIGIGSFVYLRRIFEYLIFEAYKLGLKDGAVSKKDFDQSRMDEKINLLHAYLPSFLVENKTIYSILSIGIHELDEKTCLAHFDALRVGIEIILDEKLDEIRKKEKIEAAKNKLSSVKGQIKP